MSLVCHAQIKSQIKAVCYGTFTLFTSTKLESKELLTIPSDYALRACSGFRNKTKDINIFFYVESILICLVFLKTPDLLRTFFLYMTHTYVYARTRGPDDQERS
jgi:hypothetical protein